MAHDDDPDYMPAMTMPFTLAESRGGRLSPGDRVRFTLRVGRGRAREAWSSPAAVPPSPIEATGAPPPARRKRATRCRRLRWSIERAARPPDADLAGMRPS